MGMDWFSKRKFVIVCHEKVVRIPLEGDEILRVHGEHTLGAAKALMNAKVDEPRISDIPVVRDFTDMFLGDLLGLPPQRQVEFGIDLVHGATEAELKSLEVSVGVTEEGEAVTTDVHRENFLFRLLNPLTSLTERNQKYEWSVEQEEAFQTLKNDLSVMDEAHASRLRWMIYPVVLADAAESVRDAIGFEYCLTSSSGWTK
ncbi:hypothetical protein Tco_1089487 [Tanacetum coccineum]